MRTICGFILVAALQSVLSSCSGQRAAPPTVVTQAEPSVAAVQVERPLHFTGADAADVIVEPGQYRLSAAAQSQLQFSSEDNGNTVIVSANPTEYRAQVSESLAMIIALDEDTRHVLLLLPDGNGLEAVGFFGDVRPRAGSPAPLTAIQLQNVLVGAKGSVQSAAAIEKGSTQPIFRGDGIGWLQDRGNASRTGWRVWFSQEPKGHVAWRVPVGPMQGSSPVVAPDGTIYIGTEDTNRALVAFNTNGTQKWAIPLAGQKVRTTPAIRNDGSIVVASYQQVPCNLQTGKGLIHLVSAAGQVLRISQDFSSSSLSSPLLDAQDNAYVLYRYGSKDLLIKLDGNFNSTTVGGIAYPITGSGDFCGATRGVFILGTLCGFQSTTQCPIEYQPLPPSPALFPDSDRVLIASYETALAKIGFDSLWRKNIPALFTPAIRSEVAYIGTTGKAVEAWDMAGTRKWDIHFSGYPMAPAAVGHAPSSASFYPNFLYVPAYNTAGPGNAFVWLYMIDMNTGQVKTKALGGEFSGAPSVLSISGGAEVVVVASHNNVLWAFRQDGTVLWTVPLDSKSLGTPAIVNGRIYVATETSLYAID
jgi:outer membrane protein assembly factor BamB